MVSIIVLNHNAGQLLIDCIDSIFKTKGYEYEIILVDSASTDASHKKCKEKFPNIKLIESKENVGYCKGNNIGIKVAKGNFILVLNPDTKVSSNWLAELFNAYENNGEALFQPKLLTLENDKLFNSAGNIIQTFGFGYSRGKGLEDSGQFDEQEEIGYASGACLFFPSSIIKKIGFFDPFLFVYHDDLDFGWRARQVGIKSYYVPKSIVYHAGSYYYKWSPLKFYLLERNRLYCLLTHYSKKTFYRMLPILLVVEILVLIYYFSKGLVREKIRGYRSIIKNRKLISTRYKELESQKTISDIDLIKKFSDNIFITEEIANAFSIKTFNFIITCLSKFVKWSLGIKLT